MLGRLRQEFPDVDLDRYVLFATLRTFDDLAAGPCSEMVYVHSKLLIVDDRVAVVGSANVNDRSMRGDRDTELGVVVDAPESVKKLRTRLWRAHLGMAPREADGGLAVDVRPHQRRWDRSLEDPSNLDTWRDVVDCARTNSALVEAAFDLAAWDDVATLEDAKASLGLGRVSKRVAGKPGSEMRAAEERAVRNTLERVRGDLCALPERFLHGESLEPGVLARLFVGRRLFQ